MELKGDAVEKIIDGEAPLFGAPHLVVSAYSEGESGPNGPEYSRQVWGVWDGVVHEMRLPDERIMHLVGYRQDCNKPTFVGTDKPFTMPNGEPRSIISKSLEDN